MGIAERNPRKARPCTWRTPVRAIRFHNVGRRNRSARDDPDAIAGARHERAQPVRALDGRRRRAARQDQIHAQRHQRLQRLELIRGVIEGAMEADAHRARREHEAGHRLDVDRSGPRQRAGDHAGRAGGPRGLDARMHPQDLRPVVDEIPRSRADEHVNRGSHVRHDAIDQFRRGRRASVVQRAAQFDPIDMLRPCRQRVVERVHRGFDKHGAALVFDGVNLDWRRASAQHLGAERARLDLILHRRVGGAGDDDLARAGHLAFHP